MKPTLFRAALLSIAMLPFAAQAQEPTCNRCSGTHVEQSEIQQYVDRAIANNITDQQIRALDVGKSNVAIGVVYRGKLDSPAGAAEHDLVSEVYHVISGEATLRTGWDIADKQRRPPDNRAVRLLNGPGNNGTAIRNGQDFQIKAGDVVVIPAGVGHQFMRIPDHVEYLMIRVDPDKVTPPKNAEDSRRDLAGEVADN